MQLQDKVAIITGASSGIGRTAAKLFSKQGASVVLNARREEELSQLKSEIEAQGGKAEIVVGDVQLESTHQQCVETAIEHFGKLDVCFNNAGWLGEMNSVEDVSVEGFNETMAVNLTSAFLAMKHQIPALKNNGGSIIYTTSFVGPTMGMPGMAAYAAAKAGLNGLVHVGAIEGGEYNIRVNAIASGGVDTPMGRTVADTPENKAFVEGLHALKRIAQPEEIAETALFLASGQSSFITGAILPVDGGLTKTKV